MASIDVVSAISWIIAGPDEFDSHVGSRLRTIESTGHDKGFEASRYLV